LERFVETSNIKKFGYKPWVNPDAVPEPIPPSEGEEEEESPEEDTVTTTVPVPVPVPVQVSREKEFKAPPIPRQQPKQPVPRRDPVHEPLPPEPSVKEEVRPKAQFPKNLRNTFKVSPEKRTELNVNGGHKIVEKSKANPNPILGRTPQPYDFGLTRRHTLVPKALYEATANHLSETTTSNFSHHLPQQNTSSHHEVSLEKGLFGTDSATCRFNFGTMSLNYKVPENNVTPPNVYPGKSLYPDQEEETVEFTPGLTTKRPVGAIQRLKPKTGTNIVDKPFKEINIDFDRHLPKTPKQPIPSNSLKSAQLLKPVSNSGTPQMPTLSIDEHLHKRFLAQAKK
jgi:hypothetical protein